MLTATASIHSLARRAKCDEIPSCLAALQARRIVVREAVRTRAYRLEEMREERRPATGWRAILPGAAVLVGLERHARALAPHDLPSLLHLKFGRAADVQVHFTPRHPASNPPAYGRHGNWNVESIHQAHVVEVERGL